MPTHDTNIVGKVVVITGASFEVEAESGTWYQGGIQVFWDDKPDGAIRVMASIDDGGWRAFVPLTDDFILAPDGTFVGE